MDKHKLITELENVVYSSENKFNSDEVMIQYIELISYIDLTNYRINIQKNPLKLIFKHKAFNKKASVYISNNNIYINKQQVEIDNVDSVLLKYFVDKRKDE